MVLVIMMAFITHCLTKRWSNWLTLFCVATLFWGVAPWARAQTVPTTPIGEPLLKFERYDNSLWLSAQLQFDLPLVVEDALLKGIPIYFVAEVDVLRERWYWTNRKLISLQRNLRLSYHPLTRRWRLNVSAGEVAESSQGLALNQNFDNLEAAMDAVRRISHWRIAELVDIEPGATHFVEFRFRLNLTQLPRPLQIGTLGQSEWRIQLSAKQNVSLDVSLDVSK